MTQDQVKLIKKHYQEGQRIVLINMDDPFTTLTAGDEGTITHVDDIGQIHVSWDNGSSLALNYLEDDFTTK